MMPPPSGMSATDASVAPPPPESPPVSTAAPLLPAGAGLLLKSPPLEPLLPAAPPVAVPQAARRHPAPSAPAPASTTRRDEPGPPQAGWSTVISASGLVCTSVICSEPFPTPGSARLRHATLPLHTLPSAKWFMGRGENPARMPCCAAIRPERERPSPGGGRAVGVAGCY